MRSRKVYVLQPEMRIDYPQLQNSIAVVIDILRASTTIVTALASGCRKIIPVVEIEDALKIATSQASGNVLLCGERNGNKIKGFDLGNSPLEYSAERLAGRTLVFTTSNGTRALKSAAAAKQVFVLSFLNFQVVSDLLCEKSENIFIFCSGTNGRESIEDSVCAGMLCKTMKSTLGDSLTLNDAAKDAIELAQQHQNDLSAMLKNSKHGSFLIDEGFAADLELCAGLNTQSVIPVFEEGLIHKKYEKPLHAESEIGKTLISK